MTTVPAGPRRGGFTDSETAARLRLTGLVLLGAASGWAPLAAQTVRGRVTEQSTNAPVVDAAVRLLTEQRVEAAHGTTDSAGRFTLVAPRPGRYRVRFERLGYRPVITQAFQLRVGETAEYELQVAPLAPFALDTVTVEGRLVPPVKLAGFYRRRARGLGRFITREEFEPWYPKVVSDVVRRARTFDVQPNPNYGGPLPNGMRDLREYRIGSRRALQGLGECPPLIYLDDARLGSAQSVNLDYILDVEVIEAMEFYDGVQVPIEYQSQGSNCGVIVAWSRVPGGAPGMARRLELGGQVGGQLSGDGFRDGRLGVQGAVGLTSVFEFYPAFNVFVSGWEGSGTPRSGWQALVILRARPLGLHSPWYVGAGFTTIDTERGSGDLFQERSTKEYAVLLTGIRIPARWVQPLAEFQVLDPTHPSQAQFHLFTGLALRVF